MVEDGEDWHGFKKLGSTWTTRRAWPKARLREELAARDHGEEKRHFFTQSYFRVTHEAKEGQLVVLAQRFKMREPRCSFFKHIIT